MEYFKVNYNKLENLKQIKFFIIIIFIILIILLLIILSLKINITSSITSYGVYSNNSLILKINNELSDIIKRSEYITFNDKDTKFEIDSFGEYEIVDNVIYQSVVLTVDEKFYDNEVGEVKFYYDKTSIFKYILKLFK